MMEDTPLQEMIVSSTHQYDIELRERIEYIKEHTSSYFQEQIEDMSVNFRLNIEQEVQNENHHHVCESIDLGQEYDEHGNPKHTNLKYVAVKFMRRSEFPHIISFFVDEVDGKKIATLQHILRGNQIQHRGAQESTNHWILLQEFVNRNMMRNKTMKKLNITKERFEKSRYFQNKYGSLKYVSESGKVFKTSKGMILKFNESFEVEDLDQRFIDKLAQLTEDNRHAEAYHHVAIKCAYCSKSETSSDIFNEYANILQMIQDHLDRKRAGDGAIQYEIESSLMKMVKEEFGREFHDRISEGL